jgi:pyrimidine-nucleoside phosphorylase
VLFADLLLRKRNGARLAPAEIHELIRAYLCDEVTDYQMAAFLMAVWFVGLDPEETAALVEAMTRSGEVLDLSAVPGVKVDKHGLGGAAQPVSELVVPLVAAAGVPVPMMSGRGMGHTRGTLDKLEAIPGFRADLAPGEIVAALRDVGGVIVGATSRLVPADRRLLALRATTGTIDSVPLIAASVLSKKFAEGADRVVVDVKVGSGSLIPDGKKAEELAALLVAVGHEWGRAVVCYLTDMDQPLGYRLGTLLELEEVVAILRGRMDPRSRLLREVALVLAGEMLVLGERAPSHARARARLEELIASGAALAKLREIVERQGGDPRVLDDPARGGTATHTLAVEVPATGFVARMNAFEVGMAAVTLGAGRQRMADAIDRSAGIVLRVKRGSRVERGEVLAVLHGNDQGRLEAARARLLDAVAIGPERPAARPLVRARVDASGWHPVDSIDDLAAAG